MTAATAEFQHAHSWCQFEQPQGIFRGRERAVLRERSTAVETRCNPVPAGTVHCKRLLCRHHVIPCSRSQSSVACFGSRVEMKSLPAIAEIASITDQLKSPSSEFG